MIINDKQQKMTQTKNRTMHFKRLTISLYLSR